MPDGPRSSGQVPFPAQLRPRRTARVVRRVPTPQLLHRHRLHRRVLPLGRPAGAPPRRRRRRRAAEKEADADADAETDHETQGDVGGATQPNPNRSDTEAGAALKKRHRHET